MENTHPQNQVFELFLRRLLSAPPGKQQSAIKSALALLDGAPPPDQLLLSAGEAARILSISKMSVWRLVKNGVIKPVVIPGLKNPKYLRAELEKLAGGQS